MQRCEATQVGGNKRLLHHLMPRTIPSLTISATTLHAIALEFLPADPLASAKAHDAPIPLKSEAQSRLCMAK